MKSYFAKLAARATLPNAPPAPSRAVPMSDPFENVSMSSTPPATENVSLSEGPKTQSSDSGYAQPTVRSDQILLSREHDRDVAREADTYVQPLTQRGPNADPHPNLPEGRQENKWTDQEPPKESPVLKLEPARNVHQQPEPEDTRATTPSVNAVERREDAAHHSVADIPAEQTVALKKADEFMNALFARRTAPPAPEPKQEKERPAPVVKPVAPRESTSRLQPAAKPRQPAELPPEQPSLVIGKLTVEVVPPPSPPVTQRREVVVVRGGSNSRSAPIHSSQRFGLGQF